MTQPIPSATMIILRDRPDTGLEVLLTQRSSRMSVGAGHWVFPGGQIDAGDRTDSSDPLQAALNAAIRETREEVGLVVDPGDTVHFSHWLTPESMKKRFSTWFFLGPLVGEQTLVLHPGEVHDSRWLTPGQALDATLAGSMQITPPAHISLLTLAEFDSAAEALAHHRSVAAPAFKPRIVKDEGQMVALYEGDSGYEAGRLDTPDPHHRAYFQKNGFQYVNTLR